MQGLTLVLFAMAAGFTASSIVASLYRMVNDAPAPERRAWLRPVLLVFAGPNLILDAAVKGFAAKTWAPLLFWCAIAGLAYWSMALGLLVIGVAVSV